jgi:tRNA threonylcarbamoyladenosine biosynthesis protein TsaB
MSNLDSPCLLAIDTATEVVHLALLARGQCRAQALPGGAQASATTLPAAQALLAEAGLAWADLDALAFGRGPGAFTGLRTACSLVQGLALGLGKPVLALDTLLAVADAALAHTPALASVLVPAQGQAQPQHPQQPPSAQVLWVLQDARMSEVYAAAFARDEQGGWRVVHEAQLWTQAVLRDQIAQGRVVHAAGSALGAYPEAVSGLSGIACPSASPEGAALARVALAAWQRGEQIDAALALPRYVRDKVAQTTAERAQAA